MSYVAFVDKKLLSFTGQLPLFLRWTLNFAIILRQKVNYRNLHPKLNRMVYVLQH